MSEIDWSMAPKSATHRCASTWYKNQDRIWFYWSETALEWHVTPYKSPENFNWWGANVPRPSAQAWTGSGLTPVGTVCEYLGAHQYDQWSKVNIFAQWKDLVFVDFGDGWRQERDPSRFRPIRTPEQIEAELREKIVQQMLSAVTFTKRSNREIFRQLYDLGYRKFEITDDSDPA